MSDQSLEALAIANLRRVAGADARRELVVGTITISQALADNRAAHVPVWRMLCAQHGWGPVRAETMLRVLQISGGRRCGDLTARQITLISQATTRPLGEVRGWPTEEGERAA